jgi:hypothetical protein
MAICIRSLLFTLLCTVTFASTNDWTIVGPKKLTPSISDINKVGDEFSAIDYNSAVVHKSKDGHSWNREKMRIDADESVIGIRRPARIKILNGSTYGIGNHMALLRPTSTGSWQVLDVPLIYRSGLYSLNDIDSNGAQIIAVGGKTTAQGGASVLLTSNDGASWSGIYDEFQMRLHSVRWTGDEWLIAGGHFETGGWIFTSSDGKQWKPEPVASISLTDCLEFKGRRVASAGTMDGITGAIFLEKGTARWEKVLQLVMDERDPINRFGRVNTLTVFNNVLYAAARGGVFRSIDGEAWERAVTLEGAGEFHNLRVIEGSLYAIGWPGLLYKTTNGAEWDDLNNSNQPPWPTSSFPNFLLPSWKGSSLLGSNNGEDWFTFPLPLKNKLWHEIEKVGSEFILKEHGSGKVYALSDPNTISLIYNPLSLFEDPSDLHLVGESIFSVATSGIIKMEKSEVGAWQSSLLPTSIALTNISSSEGRLIGYRDQNIYLINQANGELKPSLQLPEKERVTAIGSLGPRAIVCSAEGGRFTSRWSEDLSTWSPPSLLPGYFKSIISHSSQLRATDGNSIWVSYDAVNWAREVESDSTSLMFFYQSGELFAMSANDNYILRKSLKSIDSYLTAVSALIYAQPHSSYILGCVPSSNSSVLVRATTSELSEFGVSKALGNRATLTAFDSASRVLTGRTQDESVESYSARLSSFSSQVGAFPTPLVRAGEDADIIRSDGTPFTVRVENRSSSSGYLLIEAYSDRPVMANASIRLHLTREAPPPTFGLVSYQKGPSGILFRLTGKSLTQFGLPQTASATSMRIHHNGASIVVSESEGGSPPAGIERLLGMFPTLEQSNEPKAAIPVTSGPCTVVLESESEGEAIFEAYLIPSSP